MFIWFWWVFGTFTAISFFCCISGLLMENIIILEAILITMNEGGNAEQENPKKKTWGERIKSGLLSKAITGILSVLPGIYTLFTLIQDGWVFIMDNPYLFLFIMSILISLPIIQHIYRKKRDDIEKIKEEYNKKETDLQAEHDKRIQDLEDTYITDYPCIVKNFETFVNNYYMTIVENSGVSLYNVTLIVFGDLKQNKKDRFENDVSPVVDSYQKYQSKLGLQCEIPKKLEKKELQKSVEEFRKLMKSSESIFQHFNDYWNEFKESKKDNTETIDYRIDEYKQFYENYRLLQIEKKQISNQINSLNMRTNFLIPKAKLPEKL